MLHTLALMRGAGDPPTILATLVTPTMANNKLEL